MLCLFPVARACRVTGDAPRPWRRHHVHETVIQRAVPNVARRAEVGARVMCHAYRPSFAAHLLEAGNDIRTVRTARARGREHDDDRHARPASGWSQREVPNTSARQRGIPLLPDAHQFAGHSQSTPDNQAWPGCYEERRRKSPWDRGLRDL